MILGGVGLFLWLSLEDYAPLSAVIAGSALTLLLAYAAITAWWGGKTLSPSAWWIAAGVGGALIGGGAAVISAALMLFKNGMHAHLFPDYPPGLILAMLERAPVWALAGALIALALLLLHKPRYEI
ncbi:MAG: hypothetical protein IAE80_04435 [Anaerolinea sp.]|nr:hypothetical protein [Anaerolinea sp.]